MSFKDQIGNTVKEIVADQEKIQHFKAEFKKMQDSFRRVTQGADDIVKSTNNLATKLKIPCQETIALGECLQMLQDEIDVKLLREDVKWEDIEKEFEESNSCLRSYLKLYKTTVLNLAGLTSIELDPTDSITSASAKTSLESSSSHFQQMLVAHDPLADRDLFRNLNAKHLSIAEDIQAMKEQLNIFKVTNSNIADEVERISKAVQNVFGNNKTEVKNAL
ncbi:uncharacterized protein LOC111055155 [Nilaparvata lugens]|uniref:uncharacterized protein LOC111055155 n=1 Tax=Nilaparvata lugens TaxID=108931 RepID=UPI00193E1C03|nr:uncharacterized protein LOC111055155 [Nilaparvata lugens]